MLVLSTESYSGNSDRQDFPEPGFLNLTACGKTGRKRPACVCVRLKEPHRQKRQETLAALSSQGVVVVVGDY